ncbi:hypothetical protein QE152_g34940 [Popillia japonica]|uniref:Uncharacterized protein n=1 Tax=Popillia japonica TaxID=7064 RepID=A0AAW1IS91_POPJA
MEGNKIIERVMLKYNGLTELIQNNDGQIDFLIQTAKVKTKKNEYEENSSAVYFLPIKIDTAGVATRTEGKTIFYILGLDPTTTEDEIKQGIMRETKIRDCDVNVKGIRKGKYEEQTAIIEIPRKQAGNLIKLRKLRIGWTECGIRERIHIQRCFKCLE